MVLTADKVVSMVVMDKEEYVQKSEELLHKPTYKILPTDPTEGLDHQNIMGYPMCIRKGCH